MIKSRLALPVLFAIAGLGIGSSTQAQSLSPDAAVQSLLNPTSSAICLITGHRVFNPGISLTPSRGTFFADTATKLDCYGTIDGSRIAGPAKLELSGTYGDPNLLTPRGDTCTFGKMTGNVVVTIQTLDGRTIVVSGQTFFTRLGLELTAEGTLSGDGTAFKTRVAVVAIPDPGQTCVTTPLTSVSIAGTITVYAP